MAKQPTSELQDLYDAMVAAEEKQQEVIDAHNRMAERARSRFQQGPSRSEARADYEAVDAAIDDYQTAKSKYETGLDRWERESRG